jgi:hypothetical protein
MLVGSVWMRRGVWRSRRRVELGNWSKCLDGMYGIIDRLEYGIRAVSTLLHPSYRTPTHGRPHLHIVLIMLTLSHLISFLRESTTLEPLCGRNHNSPPGIWATWCQMNVLEVHSRTITHVMIISPLETDRFVSIRDTDTLRGIVDVNFE